MAERVLRQILAAPDRTPPHLLVSMSWGLACVVRRDPPFMAGFAGSNNPDPCKRFTAAGCDRFRAGRITPDDGKKAAGFINKWCDKPEAATWKHKLVGGVVLTWPLGINGPGFYPTTICTVCSQLRTGTGKPKGGVIKQKGQVSRHSSTNTHVAAAATAGVATATVGAAAATAAAGATAAVGATAVVGATAAVGATAPAAAAANPATTAANPTATNPAAAAANPTATTANPTATANPAARAARIRARDQYYYSY
eukprot:COSAG05_NODE_47_length_24712_cov_26.673844_9_plen_254_part_00